MPSTAAHFGRPRELPKILSTGEIAALMAAPNLDCPTGLRNRCMLELMYRSGLRVSETCGLHMRDIDFDDGVIQLRAAITKGSVDAVAYFDGSVGPLLERWKAERRRFGARRPHLFTTLQGGPIDRRYCWSMMRRYARRAGIERDVHPHMLRHTYATALLREGFDLREVQQLLRHADIRTTTIYTHLFEHELHRKVRRRRRR